MSAFNNLNTFNHVNVNNDMANGLSNNYIKYISVSPIQSYLPKDYVKMILEESFCQIDLSNSIFVPNKEINTPNYNFYDDPDAYYTAIIKVNKWHDTELANQVLNNLICDIEYTMTEYNWSVQKYNMDDNSLNNNDIEMLENLSEDDSVYNNDSNSISSDNDKNTNEFESDYEDVDDNYDFSNETTYYKKN
jgi:hypothetical protein